MVELSGKENIIFDLGGVLLNIDYELTANAFKRLGLESFDAIYSQKKQTGVFDSFEIGQMGSAEFVDELRRVISGTTEQSIIDAWNAMLLDLPKHRIDLLENLKKDYRIFLLSNTNQIHEEAFIQIIENSFGSNILFDQFEEVYLSHRIGQRKPDVSCFQYVLDINGLAPERTVFIDDSIQHVEGAKRSGIDGYLLNNGEDITQLFPDRFQPASH